MKDSNFTQAYNSIKKIFEDNWVNEDVPGVLEEHLAHKQNQELISNVMLGCMKALEEYDPDFDIVFNQDWVDCQLKRIKE